MWDQVGRFWDFSSYLDKAPKLQTFKRLGLSHMTVEKEWTITLDVPEHFEDDTFTVHDLIAGLSFGFFQFQELPNEAKEKIREEMKKRGRFGDSKDRLYDAIKAKKVA